MSEEEDKRYFLPLSNKLVAKHKLKSVNQVKNADFGGYNSARSSLGKEKLIFSGLPANSSGGLAPKSANA